MSTVIVNSPEKPLTEDSFLFHWPSFIELRHNHLMTFSLMDDDSEIARISLEQHGKSLVSLPFAPFGGVDQKGKSEDVSSLISKIIELANQKNITKIAITSAPNIYNQENYDIQKKCLKQMGFLSQDYLVQVIKITSADFNSIIGADKRRYLKKCEDFIFRKLNSSYLKPLYSFIGQQRAYKGYDLSVTYQQMEELMHELPEAITLFGVFDKSNKLVAASISIHVNKEVLYDFHHDDLLEKRHLGATATLIKGIYEFCQAKKYKTLDLGGSTLNNEINTGLYKYKKSLGAVDAHKTTYTLTR